MVGVFSKDILNGVHDASEAKFENHIFLISHQTV